nr:RNA-directed DNA polymerase, eukaryota, reverse transcriptase zinc-binding domain protein [Tanacetum cinerariifolium]
MVYFSYFDDLPFARYVVLKKGGNKGEKVVLFDEELVREGSEKWKLTVCGYFVGCKMHVNVVKYNVKRMWGKFGLKDIMVDAEGMCFFKFKKEEGMKYVIDQSPPLVNGKPLIVQRWDPKVVIVKESPYKILIRIRLYNVPPKAWSIKSISAISSRLGRPMMMDQMTSDMCKERSGRLGYARVLVEIDASKPFLDKVEINYVDDAKNAKHVVSGESEKRNSKNMDHLDNNEEGFVEVKNKKNRNGINGIPKPPYEEPRNKQSSPPKVQSLNIDKRWKVNKENVEELKKSANKYALLSEEENKEERVDLFIDKRLIVDEFIKKKLQPLCIETKEWTYDKIKYFKYAWEAMERKDNVSSVEEDMYENTNQVVNYIIVDEVKSINKACNWVFGNWNWVSNADLSPTSYRIVIGWNSLLMDVMIIHSCR